MIRTLNRCHRLFVVDPSPEFRWPAPTTCKIIGPAALDLPSIRQSPGP